MLSGVSNYRLSRYRVSAVKQRLMAKIGTKAKNNKQMTKHQKHDFHSFRSTEYGRILFNYGKHLSFESDSSYLFYCLDRHID